MKQQIWIALSCLCIGLPVQAWAQIEQATLGNLGGEISNLELSLIQSIGEFAGLITNEEVELTQGFVQFFNCDECTKGPEVSVEASISHPQISLFPNPSGGQMELRGPRELLHHYELLNAQGQRVLTAQLTGAPIDHSYLPIGLYLIRTYDRNQQLTAAFQWLKQ